MKNGSRLVISDTGLFLPEYATSDTGSSLLIEGTSAVVIAHSLFGNSFFAIIILRFGKCTTYFETVVVIKYVKSCNCW